MTSLTFETATLADSLKKAARVAPTKGSAFDKASGVVLIIDPDGPEQVMVKATDLQIFYTEIVDCTTAEGTPDVWRLPSQLIAAVVGSLPIGSGKTVTLNRVGNQIKLTSARTKATFNLINAEYYPTWQPFDPTNLETVSSLGARIQQVEWAADKANEPLNGIHFNGTHAVATDKYRIAVAECELPIEEPVTIPVSVLSSVLKLMGDTKVGYDGERVQFMPDEHTQIEAVVFGGQYPNTDRVIARTPETFVRVRKAELLEMIGRARNFSGTERFPTLRVFIGLEEIAVMMAAEDVGLLGDVIEVPGQCTHERVEIRFTPDNLVGALNASPNDEVAIHYEPVTGKGFVAIDGGSGYRAVVMPRKDVAKNAD